MASVAESVDRNARESLAACYARVRSASEALCGTLQVEDTVVQSMTDASPTKWHLAHVTWFFEQFVLDYFLADYKRFDDRYNFIFNSYYYSVGQMHARPQRGLLTRPTFEDVLSYRLYVDEAMQRLLADRDGDGEELGLRVTLGLNHEQQHQELLLTDIKHVLFQNPLRPAMNPDLPLATGARAEAMLFMEGDTGLQDIGAEEQGFSFDNETPRHKALLYPHEIASRLVCNSEFREFIRDGGYRKSELWLADGWSTVQNEAWDRPLYWDESLEREFTLAGTRQIDDAAPVCHVSYYEADALARWAGARLPTEFEWERAANKVPVAGNLMESDFWHPQPASGSKQFFGDVWEWTSSANTPYPGFKALEGSLGEYNGKFMCNQITVRGGSCVTSADHIRASYRSFFYPDARWQFLGLRLGKDVEA